MGDAWPGFAGGRDLGGDGIDLLIAKLHRLRDQLTREVRDWDREHRPYNDRD
jgi:hypothetical protein